MAFSRSSMHISLSGTHLRAKCRDRQGRYHDSAIDINNYIVNDNGVLKWQASGNFAASSRGIVIEGSVLRCQSRSRRGDWCRAQINLDEKIANFNGKLIYAFERAIIHVDEKNVEEVTQYMKDVYDAHKGEVSTQVADGGTYKVLYINTGSGKDEGIILQVSAGAEASVFHVVGEHQGGMATVNFDFLQAKAGAWASIAGAGIGVSANLVDMKASVFDLTLGVGLDTGVGIQNDSFTVEALGCGFTLGRQMKISVLGSSFGVDFGRCSVM